MRTCIGLDVGRSSTKVIAVQGSKKCELLIPSAVCPAIVIHLESEAAHARSETITVNQRTFFFGNSALLQGQGDLTAIFHDEFVFTDEHNALFLGALAKVNEAGVPGVEFALIIVGLPAALFAIQRSKLAQQLSILHPRAVIRVVPQPLGRYQQMLFAPDGSEVTTKNPGTENWAVIEVGQHTTDYALLLNGRAIENASGSCNGMRLVAQNLQREIHKSKISISMAEATESLRTGIIKKFKQMINVSAEIERLVKPLANQITDKAAQLIGKNARQLDGVLLAGGGAPLILPYVLRVWPHAQMANNPRFAVADGFCRFAQAVELISIRQKHSISLSFAK